MIIIDAGNSKVAVARWESASDPRDDSLTRLFKVSTPESEQDRQECLGRIAETARASENAPVVVASVVPSFTEALVSGLPEVVVVDHRLDFPFDLEVEDPSAVGADRYCNVAAAVRLGAKKALVVDAGTATTFDILQAGIFIGGLIAPGMAFASAKLGENAARLRPVEFVPCPLETGRNTERAMQAGAYHVGVNGVVATIAALVDRYGDRPLFVTGGLAEMLAGGGRALQPDFTLWGAAHLGALALGIRRLN